MSSTSPWTVKSFLTEIGVDESDVDAAATALMAAGYKTEQYLLMATRESLEKANVALPIIDLILAHQQQQQQQQRQQPANILGEGVYEKLAASTVFFKDGEGNAIGTGFTFSGNRAMTAAHNFPDAEIGAKVVGYFGKPQVGTCYTFEVVSVDKELDYCVLKRDSGEEFAVWLELKGPDDHMRPGQVCILAAFQIGLHRDLTDLDPDHTIGVYQGNIVKTHARHFVYSCPSFAGDSGGAIIWQNGRVIGLHQETVNQALERKRQHDMDLEDRMGSVEKSLDSLTANVSSGAIGLSVVAVPQHLLV